MRRRWLRPVFAGTALLRNLLTQGRIRREVTQSFPTFTSRQIGETRTLEILPLYEAMYPDTLRGGPGVSYLVRTDHAAILFDVGHNPSSASPSPLEQNMATLGVSLDTIDLLVISHRHPDHVGGMTWWKQRTFSPGGASQPALGALPIYASDPLVYPGSQPRLTVTPMRLVEGVATTGAFTFFEPYPAWQITPNYTEHAIAVNVAGWGMVLITGCGHMGLKTLLERARAIFDVPVAGVIGGLHYQQADAEMLQPEIQLLQECQPRIVALSPHDSGPAALDAFARAFPHSYHPIHVGETISIP